jgi:4-amino-4-deoxy-L-arabinose transferase-like glycosyltransferase
MKADNISEKRGIFLICMVYLVVSLAFFVFVFHGEPIFESDTPSYVDTAKHMIKDGFFSLDGIVPEYSRTPGYPLFLASIYALGGNDSAAVIVQIFLSSLGLYVFYRILLMVGTPKHIALLASVFLLFNTTQYEYTFRILTEFLFGFFLLLAVYFLVKYLQSKKAVFFFLFSFAMNYALLIRPILIYFNMLTLAVILICLILKKIRLKCFCFFLAFFVIFFCGWSYRNYIHSSVFIYSTIQNHNVKDYYCRMITADIDGITESEALVYHNEIFRREYPEAVDGSLNVAQVSVLEGKYGTTYLMAHFPQYVKLNVTGFFKMMLRPGIRTYLENVFHNGGIAWLLSALIVLYLVTVYILYILGLLVSRKKMDVPQLYIFLLCGYLAAASAVLGISRLRAPFFPLLMLGAAVNFETLKNRLIAPNKAKS